MTGLSLYTQILAPKLCLVKQPFTMNFYFSSIV